MGYRPLPRQPPPVDILARHRCPVCHEVIPVVGGPVWCQTKGRAAHFVAWWERWFPWRGAAELAAVEMASSEP